MLADILRRKSVNPRVSAHSHRHQRHLTVESLEQRLVLYNLSGDQWADTNITFSYAPDGTDWDGDPNSLFAELNDVASTEVWQREFARALQTWAQAANVNFHEVPDDGTPKSGLGYTQGDIRFGDIRLGMRLTSGLAHAHYPPYQEYGFTSPGDITLNSGHNFAIGSTYDLYSVLLHESGHSLGLGHEVAPAVMSGVYAGVQTGLTADDIAGIQAMYGARQDDEFDAAASNDTLGSATTISLSSGGAMFSADLTSQADVDYYRVVVPSGSDGTLTVSVDARELSLLAPSVSVHNASGMLLAQNAVGTYGYGSVATVNLSGLTAGATYYLAADGATSDAFGVGAYVFDVQFGGDTGDPSPGITVTPTSGLETTESGGTANFDVVLDSQPTADVSINISSSDTTEGTVSLSSLTFTSANWNSPQTVVITGVEDTVLDSDVGYTIVTGAAVSSDGNYSGLDPADVSVINLDNDAPPPSPGLDPDRFEVNDDMAAATDLGTTNGLSETGLSIHTSSDKDYFSFVPRKDGSFRIATQFSHASGNLDLTVYDAAGNVVGSSTTNTDNEQVTLSLNGRQRYYFRVHSSAGDTNTHGISITNVGGGGGNGKGNGNGKPKGQNLVAPHWMFAEYSDGDHAHDHPQPTKILPTRNLVETELLGLSSSMHGKRSTETVDTNDQGRAANQSGMISLVPDAFGHESSLDTAILIDAVLDETDHPPNDMGISEDLLEQLAGRISR